MDDETLAAVEFIQFFLDLSPEEKDKMITILVTIRDVSRKRDKENEE